MWFVSYVSLYTILGWKKGLLLNSPMTNRETAVLQFAKSGICCVHCWTVQFDVRIFCNSEMLIIINSELTGFLLLCFLYNFACSKWIYMIDFACTGRDISKGGEFCLSSQILSWMEADRGDWSMEIWRKCKTYHNCETICAHKVGTFH